MDEIRQLLTKYNKTALARELGVTRYTIYNWLEGKSEPRASVYQKIKKLTKNI